MAWHPNSRRRISPRATDTFLLFVQTKALSKHTANANRRWACKRHKNRLRPQNALDIHHWKTRPFEFARIASRVIRSQLLLHDAQRCFWWARRRRRSQQTSSCVQRRSFPRTAPHQQNRMRINVSQEISASIHPSNAAACLPGYVIRSSRHNENPKTRSRVISISGELKNNAPVW